MAPRAHFSADDARHVGAEIGIDWDSAPFDLEQFRKGMEVELEHGLHDQAPNVTSDDPVVTGKIVLAHLNEFSRLLHAARADGGASQARDGSALVRHFVLPGNRPSVIGVFTGPPLPLQSASQWLATDDDRIRNEPKPMRSAYRTSRSWIARRGAIPC
jgi:hypothetical protein